MSHDRFFLDHGAIHDRMTGKHVGMQAEIDWQPRLLSLLNDMWEQITSLERAGLKAARPEPQGWMLETANSPRDVVNAPNEEARYERLARNLLQPVQDCFIRLRDKNYAVAARQVQIAMESDGGAVEKLFYFLKSHAPKAVPDLGKFVNISPVVMEGFPDAHRVTFDVGSQHFDIAPNGCETKEDAEWMRDMFLRALSKVAAQPEGMGDGE